MASTRVRLEFAVAATMLAVFEGWYTGNARGANTGRPNVVVFLADDQGWGDLSLTGNPHVQTPHIDSLARVGVSLANFFVCPVCSPTRAEFLTGRYHPRCGVRGVSTGQERMDLDEATVAEAFQAAGYATACFGKWHNGSQWPYHPNARGFDEFYGFTSGHWGEYFDAPLEYNGQPVRGKGFTVDEFTERGMQFIEQHRSQPFFCYLAYNTPHSPFIVPNEYWQRFKDKPITARGADGERETVDVTRAVLAMCENIDWNVGRVLAKLDDLHLAKNTIVIYFSDNGPNSVRWNGGMKGRKGSTDEGGLHSVCVVRWPDKLKRGTSVQEIAGAIDLLPTLTSLAGVEPIGDKPLDGVDLSPLLLSTAHDWPERMIFSHWAGRVSVRTQRYRMDDRGRLFDMVADRGQESDIRSQQPALAAKLEEALAAWRKEVFNDESTQSGARGQRAPLKSSRVDDRPFPVGYAEFPRTPLPARDGHPHGGVRRSASAPNCSYFVNWTSTEDAITWDIEVAAAGQYDVEILYTCPEADAGSTIELTFRNSKLTGQVTPGWDPPRITDQDVIPRPPAESVMKEFRPLKLGTIELTRGRGPLTLRALDIPSRQVMHLRQINLTLQMSSQ
jgi:arylsulfatase A-like enzyme